MSLVTDKTTAHVADRLRGLLFRHEGILLMILAAALIVLALQSEQFLTVDNLLNQGRLMTEIGLVALPMTFVIVTGGIDLSVGSIMGLCAIVLGYSWKNLGLPLEAAIVVALATGTAAGFVNGWGAIIIGVVASTIVYFALNYLSRAAPFRNVDDTLGVVYTHGFAGLAGGLLVGIFANSAMAETTLAGTISGGGLHLLGWQALTALWVIVFSSIGTFILLKLVGLVVPLRMTDEEMEIGDIAVHGHEVYPSDVPSLGYPDGVPAAAGSAT